MIQYLASININEINRDDYFSLLLRAESADIITIRRKFYDIVPKIYDLLVQTNFPNVVNELKFFNNFNLLIIAFDSSPRNKLISGVELSEKHYYLQSLSTNTDKIIIYDSIDDCPIKLDNFSWFNKPIEINGIPYNLKVLSGTHLNQCEATPLLTFAHNLLKRRLISYLDKKMTTTHRLINITNFDSSTTIY